MRRPHRSSLGCRGNRRGRLARCRLRLERQRELVQQQAHRLGARHHREHDHDRQPSAAHRRRGSRLRRDSPVVQRLLPVRQRARRHLRPEDHLQVPERPVRPDHHLDRGAPARAAGQRVRDLQRARHADAPGRGEVPERLQGARRVRRVRLRVLEQPEHLPGHVRLAARLRARGQDPRQVHRRALRRQEDRLLLPGRRVRPGRRQGPELRDPEVPGRRSGELQPGGDQRRAAGDRAQGGRGPGRGLVLGSGVHRAAAAEQPQAELRPAARGQRRRVRPDHPGRPARVVRQAGRRHGVRQRADPGDHHRRLPALARRHQQQLDQADDDDPQQVPEQVPDGRQRGVRDRGRVHVRAGDAQGRAQPDPAGPDQRDQRRPAAGILRGPLRLLVE